ncbi:MAG: GntR family transcriptional regulator [Hyphomicrobiaceae bacterium]|nr:GntR family transcriptional regulator [Hyphomicrobiaceae bacterium]
MMSTKTSAILFDSSDRPLDQSLGDYVHQELKRFILDGKYRAGERIRESDITSELKVSRTPVREAFRRLQSEGLLKFEAQRGVVVAELDRQEVAELYAMRQHMEGFAARCAAQHATESEIEAMEYILAQTKIFDDKIHQFNQINWELHYAIYTAAHNRFLIRAFEALSDSMSLLQGAKYIPAGRPTVLHEEHGRIVEAIKQRDPDAADKAAQHHVRNAFLVHLEVAFHERTGQQVTKATP